MIIETLSVITLSGLLLNYFRPGKTEPLHNPLVIHRVGQFHATLAPMLNLSQPLLENVLHHLGPSERQAGNSSSLYFTVTDKEVQSHGEKFYLLAATLRDGEIYFQAVAPQKKTSDLETIRAFAEAEMARHPATFPQSSVADTALLAAVKAAADERGATVATVT